jgi:hypothetical protein
MSRSRPRILAMFSDFVDGFAPLQFRVVNFCDRLSNFFFNNPLDSILTLILPQQLERHGESLFPRRYQRSAL